jgi:hypothetical protein
VLTKNGKNARIKHYGIEKQGKFHVLPVCYYGDPEMKRTGSGKIMKG